MIDTFGERWLHCVGYKVPDAETHGHPLGKPRVRHAVTCTFSYVICLHSGLCRVGLVIAIHDQPCTDEMGLSHYGVSHWLVVSDGSPACNLSRAHASYQNREVDQANTMPVRPSICSKRKGNTCQASPNRADIECPGSFEAYRCATHKHGRELVSSNMCRFSE
jgi:hypothetical protein